MYIWTRFFIITLLGLLASAVALRADTVTLKNGDTLTGTVVSANEKNVTLNHPVLGKIQIAAANVKSIHITHKTPQTKPAARSVSQESTPAVSVSEQAAAAKTPKLNQSHSFFDRPFFQGWDSEFALGLAGSSGNTKTQSFNAEFKTKKETTKVRWLFDSKYFYNSDHSQTTENQFSAQLTHDWLLPNSPWFYFARGRYEYDQFQAWKSRISAYGGGGYTFIDKPDLQVLSRLGFGATKDLGGDHSLTPEALVGGSVIKWKITKNQTINLSETFYPALDNLGQFRNIFDADWKIKIDQADGLSVKLGIEDQYNSHVTGGDKRNDFKYYGAVVFDF